MRFLSRLSEILKWILDLFNRKPRFVIPHPEEPQNEDATSDNTDMATTREGWFLAWDVPIEHRLFWTTDVTIELSGQQSGTYIQPKIINLNFKQANPGVLAHEAAHVSYGLLSDLEKVAFEDAFIEAISVDGIVKYLYNLPERWYMGTISGGFHIEGHADVYRFLGGMMPAELKRFYPRL
jgi:hypothetical protein